jgi:hypothetical protein
MNLTCIPPTRNTEDTDQIEAQNFLPTADRRRDRTEVVGNENDTRGRGRKTHAGDKPKDPAPGGQAYKDGTNDKSDHCLMFSTKADVIL